MPSRKSGPPLQSGRGHRKGESGEELLKGRGAGECVYLFIYRGEKLGST